MLGSISIQIRSSKHLLTHTHTYACASNIFHHHRLRFGIIIIIAIILSVFISTHGDIELRIFVANEEAKRKKPGQSECDGGEQCIISSYCRQCHMHHHPCSSRKLNITNFHETPYATHAHICDAIQYELLLSCIEYYCYFPTLILLIITIYYLGRVIIIIIVVVVVVMCTMVVVVAMVVVVVVTASVTEAAVVCT